MLPEEDRGPAWLRDWGNTTGYTNTQPMTGWVDGDALAVDIQDLVAFADALRNEHIQDFQPHVREVYTLMEKDPTPAPPEFVEFAESMTHHRNILVQTSSVMYQMDQAVLAFAQAAHDISETYGSADAFSSASVQDVEGNLGTPAPGTAQPTTMTPEQANAETPEQPAPGTTPPVTAPATDPATTTNPGSPDNGRDYS